MSKKENAVRKGMGILKARMTDERGVSMVYNGKDPDAKVKIRTESAMILYVDRQYPNITDEQIEALVPEDCPNRDRIILMGQSRRKGHRSIDIAYLKATGKDPTELGEMTDPAVKDAADNHYKERQHATGSE